MRDPKRIDDFCEELKVMWRRVPDWRFGQLMSNFFGNIFQETGKDIWFIEEPEMLKYVTEYMLPSESDKCDEYIVASTIDTNMTLTIDLDSVDAYVIKNGTKHSLDDYIREVTSDETGFTVDVGK